MVLTVTGTGAKTHSRHSYDGDWGNTQSWQDLMHQWSIQNGVPGNVWQSFVYDYIYRADRDCDTRSLDVRLVSEHDDALNWLLGVYALNLREHIREVTQGDYQDPVAYAYFSSTDDFLDSRYDATNAALYRQLDGGFATDGNGQLACVANVALRTITITANRLAASLTHWMRCKAKTCEAVKPA